MLTLCPECSQGVSDHALFCPHCGYPLKKSSSENKKHPKLPSRFGQISKINNPNLQKPYRVMISVKSATSNRSRTVPLKPVSYFMTYHEAFAALVEYNRNPDGYVNTYVTFEELYKSWLSRQADMSTSLRHRIQSAWNYSSGLYTYPVVSIKIKTLRSYIENCKAPLSIKPVMKQLYNQLFDFAIEDDIIDKNWVIDMILVQCYSGWRPTELCELKTENIDFKSGTTTM